MAIAQHFGRPGTPTDQAWIESLFGHVKPSGPTCSASPTPPYCEPSSPSSAATTTAPGSCRNRVRHPPRRTRRPWRRHPQSPPGRPRSRPPPTPHLPAPTAPAPTRPGIRRCWLIRSGSLSRSRKQVAHRQPCPRARREPRRRSARCAATAGRNRATGSVNDQRRRNARSRRAGGVSNFSCGARSAPGATMASIASRTSADSTVSAASSCERR
jgi:hypothetical protein